MKLEGGIKELQGYDSLGWSWLLGVCSNVDGRGRALTKKWMEGVLSFANMDKLSRLSLPIAVCRGLTMTTYSFTGSKIICNRNQLYSSIILYNALSR